MEESEISDRSGGSATYERTEADAEEKPKPDGTGELYGDPLPRIGILFLVMAQIVSPPNL